MGAAVGIDLGTTNSCIATVEGGRPVVIPNAEGGRTTPSVVAFTDQGERLVGALALRQAAANPERTVQSVKRRMGTDWRAKINGTSYLPQELSAMILRKLKDDAEAYLGCPVTDAVITVPAYFNDTQRQATKDAGRIAGLNVQRIISEPTAATLAYGLDHGDPGKVLVFDLGGGTFDVSVIEIERGMVQVLATSGDNHLGGDDFDKRIADRLCDDFKRENGVDLRRDPAALQRVREASEAAKRELSGSTSAHINLPFIATKGGSPLHLDRELTRAEFESMTSDLLERTREPLEAALSDAHLSASDLARVLLVGGSTRMPAVAQKVRELTGKEPSSSINPDECVAMGAAIQAANLAGRGGELASRSQGIMATGESMLLVDVIPMSLAIETYGGEATRLIERNTPVPTHYSQVFTTVAPYQPSVEIRVLQGERPMARDNKLIGNFSLRGIKRAPAGVPQIEVTFDVSADSILTVSAKDLDTGRAQSITITESDRMSEDEIQRAIQEAERYSALDGVRKAGIEEHRRAERLLAEVDAALAAAGRKADRDERKQVKADEAALRKVAAKRADQMDQTDLDRLRAAVDKLEASSAHLRETAGSGDHK
jgi:molecular chaperone DnaK